MMQQFRTERSPEEAGAPETGTPARNRNKPTILWRDNWIHFREKGSGWRI